MDNIGKGAVIGVVIIVAVGVVLGIVWNLGFIMEMADVAGQNSHCQEWSDKIEQWRHELNSQWLPPPSAYDEFNTEVANYNAECA